MHDGDSITLLDEDNRQHKIRLDGIDAPELGQPFGQSSKRHISDLVAIGVPGVTFVTTLDSVPVRADFGALADVFQNLLANAGRYRLPGTEITIALTQDDWEAVATVRNQGPHIPEEKLDRIFDLGFSEHQESTGHLGLGLFLAALYMNKMGGSVRARNVADGVEFEIRLRRADV